MTVFVGDFIASDVNDDDDDVNLDDVKSSIDASFLARATANRIRPCLTLAQWFCVLRTLG